MSTNTEAETVEDQKDTDTTGMPVSYSEETLRMLEEKISRLPPRSQEAMRMRYGLQDGRFHTREEVAQAFSMTADRIYTIEQSMLRIHSHIRRAKRIEDFYN